jgi:hypothetical protein
LSTQIPPSLPRLISLPAVRIRRPTYVLLSSAMLRLMAKQFKPVGSVSVAVPGELKDGPVTEMSVGAVSGPLGSVVHGLRIEVSLHVGSEGKVTFSMAAADALQLAEELRAAVHRRDDVRRG